MLFLQEKFNYYPQNTQINNKKKKIEILENFKIIENYYKNL